MAFEIGAQMRLVAIARLQGDLCEVAAGGDGRHGAGEALKRHEPLGRQAGAAQEPPLQRARRKAGACGQCHDTGRASRRQCREASVDRVGGRLVGRPPPSGIRANRKGRANGSGPVIEGMGDRIRRGAALDLCNEGPGKAEQRRALPGNVERPAAEAEHPAVKRA